MTRRRSLWIATAVLLVALVASFVTCNRAWDPVAAKAAEDLALSVRKLGGSSRECPEREVVDHGQLCGPPTAPCLFYRKHSAHECVVGYWADTSDGDTYFEYSVWQGTWASSDDIRGSALKK